MPPLDRVWVVIGPVCDREGKPVIGARSAKWMTPEHVERLVDRWRRQYGALCLDLGDRLELRSLAGCTTTVTFDGRSPRWRGDPPGGGEA